MSVPRLVHPRFALVTAPGCHVGPDTFVHVVYETLTEARRRQNKRQVIVLCTEDDDYMVPGHRFRLNPRDIIPSPMSRPRNLAEGESEDVDGYR